jgi:thiamine biosynthesis protein ThiI
VLRPLITTNKTDIIKIARDIGTEDFAASMPEYCGVISVKPTTHARQHKIDAEEEKFNFAVLDKAIANAKVQMIEKLGDTSKEPTLTPDIYATIPEDAVIIDIRHPDEEDLDPLDIDATVSHIPFYQLHRKAQELDANTLHLLYCAQGVMSRLHASHLIESGLSNFHVYRPE